MEGGDSCVLDVADRVADGDHLTLEQLAALFGIHRTRMIWLLRMALIKLRAHGIDVDSLSASPPGRGTLVADE